MASEECPYLLLWHYFKVWRGISKYRRLQPSVRKVPLLKILSRKIRKAKEKSSARRFTALRKRSLCEALKYVLLASRTKNLRYFFFTGRRVTALANSLTQQ